MIRTYTVIDEAGLHARPASLMVKEVSGVPEEVNIIYKDKKLTMKSIMVVMSLGIPCGAEFSIEIIGENETTLFDLLEGILKEHNVI